MAAVLPSKLQQLSRATDPRDGLWKAVGSAINDIQVFGAQLLVGTYIKSEKTAGGILLPDSVKQEDLWQGNLGLVLKKGPWAFQDDERLNIDWKGQDVEVGDWVILRYSDALEMHLNGVSVRLIDDRDIRGVVSRPEILASKPIAALGE